MAFSNTPNTTIFVKEFGSGFPVLIIHGWETSGNVEAADLEPVFTTTPGLLRIYVDLPGMGSTPAQGIKSLDDIYNHLVTYIDGRFSTTTKFALVGGSCGAYLARALAQKYSKQVDGLILRVPLLEPRDKLRDLDPFEPVVKNEALMNSLSVEQRTALGNVPVQTKAYIDALRAKLKNSWQLANEQSDSKVLDPIRADPELYSLSFWEESRAEKFYAPTLVLCGRHDDVVGYRDSVKLLELYPRSTFVVLDRGTHGMPIDETGVFEALVRDWVKRVQEWQSR